MPVKPGQVKQSQEFFPRGATPKTKGFIFNQAPINKREAKDEVRQSLVDNKKNKRSAFMAKLYEDENIDEDMKVFQMEDSDQEGGDNANKRNQKIIEKSQSKSKAKIQRSKIGKLKFSKGSLGLFAIHDIHEDYAIVNFTRNVKGYLPLDDKEELTKNLEVGQYIIAAVLAEGQQPQFNGEPNGNSTKKLQLSIEPELINKSLTNEVVDARMLLQGIVESKEAKGYLVNFGMKDKTKGFVAFNSKSTPLQIGQLVQVLSRTVTPGSKIIKCDIITKENASASIANKNELSMHNIKPGFCVTAKVSQLFENGIEVSFLGGFNGTIFVDHLQNQNIAKHKLADKITARIIAVDPVNKSISLSQLPHLVEFENSAIRFVENGILLGKLFEKVKVNKIVYGKSYQIQLGKTDFGFLHKIHTAAKEKGADDGAPLVPQELEIGQTLDKVRVKELNYFDGQPILSIRQDVLSTIALNYDTIEVGQTFNATIDEVNESSKYIQLRLNEFVRGKLFIEHMSDVPVKIIPPKFKTIGKEIKVRVFNVDPESRDLEFTKKDSLMKTTVPAYKSYKEVQKGAKIYGVVVGENEHGYIIASFGGIKALLTHADIKANGKAGKKDYKVGNIAKGYVLFKKHDKGMALTLDKAKAKELRKDNKGKTKGQDEEEETTSKSFKDYLPTQNELESLKEKYKSLIKVSGDASNLGKVYSFRVVESTSSYYVVKSSDAVKKSQNIVAILPKCLVSSQAAINTVTQSEQTIQGVVLETYEQVPLISTNNILVSLKEEIPKSSKDFEATQTTFIGYVSDIKPKGVIVRFIDGLTKMVGWKDLEVSQNFDKVYKVGQVVRAGKNKLDRLTLKQRVIYYGNQKLQTKDKELQIKSHYQDFELSLLANKLTIGKKIEATVQLIKDYGLILTLPSYPSLTGFVMNEHKSNKSYKEGDKIQVTVLDVDFEKNIIDLSEKLNFKAAVEFKSGSSHKAIVELSKEDYLIVSLKNKTTLAICMMNSLNRDESQNPNEKFAIGDEITVKVLSQTQSGLNLSIPEIAAPETKAKSSTSDKVGDLVPGLLINGVIKSLKGQCAFVQLLSKSELTIGRLHALECTKSSEFATFTVGQKIQAKILKVTRDSKKTWVELTKRKEHMAHATGLDADTLSKTILSMDQIKEGKSYKAVINEVNFQYSQPISIFLSPFVKSSIAFTHIISVDQLLKEGSSLLNEYTPGKQVTVYYKDGQFRLIENYEAKKKLDKGDLVVARYVKQVPGKGITIQVGDQQYGFVEITEITDDITGRVFDFIKEKALFPVRLIDYEQNGKAVYSARESVVDENKWKLLAPTGKSVHFQKYDEKLQKLGNQRNKIIKFGSKVSLHEGDLCIGYVTNIGKAGCFVQIGHNTTVRAALNELSEAPSFNFVTDMPIGRQVLGRITRIEEKNDKRWYNFSTRKPLVVYGTSVVDRSSLEIGAKIEAIVLTIADGKAFAQIKGSYLKLKIKNFAAGAIKEGDHVTVSLTKVTKQKITSEFVGKSSGKGLNEEEVIIEKLYSSIEEEAQKDIQKAQEQAQTTEIDQEMFKKVGKNQQDEVEMQLQDLKELEQDQDMEVDGEDSDQEEMQRIIKESKMYDEEEEEEDDAEDGSEEQEDAEDDAEEQSDADMEEEDDNQGSSDSDEEEDAKKSKKSGKKGLKDRIKEEQDIRKQENKMRDNKDQPQSLDEYERLIIQNQDQSFVWIQYMAFMIDKLGIESARRVAERAVKSVSISNEEDKFNIWIAYMNLENNFGNQQTLEKIVKRALEVNDRKKIYLQLISIYKASHKYEHIEDIFKQLSKKFNTSLKVWSGYLEFLFEMRELKKDKSAQHKFLISDLDFSEPKQVLQRALQSLPQTKHVNLISKFGMLEFKHGAPENGRTMFEGIVNNYPKRMDIWSIYMDMEVKHGGGNAQQARHLFERCLSNEQIAKKPKKMKLVFQKYIEFEIAQGNKKNIEKLKERAGEYAERIFKQQEKEDSE